MSITDKFNSLLALHIDILVPLLYIVGKMYRGRPVAFP